MNPRKPPLGRHLFETGFHAMARLLPAVTR